MNFKQELETDTIEQDKEYTLQFPLSSVTRPVLIENIFYEFDKATLTPESTEALDELINQIIKRQSTCDNRASSHCDYKGNDDYNMRLSQRRAESVVNYLIAGGIEKERLTAKGYGERNRKSFANVWPRN